jgi:predicted RNA-binding protein YlxR (DUF448 family)/ribosomal protein L30E
MLRACHITGQNVEPERLLRFVSAPDGQLTPDLTGKLPGTAIYVLARHQLVAQLLDGDWADKTGQLMQRHIMAQLGLARKAGVLVLGYTKTELALAKGQVALLLAAHDGAVHGKKALAAKARAQGVEICAILGRAELGMALGRANVIHAGLTDAAWATRIGQQALRLRDYEA